MSKQIFEKLNNENNIIDLAKRGDQKAFKKLFDQHLDSLFRFLLQFAYDRATAQDWTQQSFISAFESIHQFSGRSEFKTWLFAIGLNEMRSDKRIKWEFESYDSQLHVDNNYSLFSPDDWMSARSAIRNMKPNQRLVFLLFEVEGYSHKEIAEMLDIKESHSRVILTRAKKELIQLIDQ